MAARGEHTHNTQGLPYTAAVDSYNIIIIIIKRVSARARLCVCVCVSDVCVYVL